MRLNKVLQYGLHRILIVAILASAFAAGSKAQVLSSKNVGGKQITCLHSGLTGDFKGCGPESFWYAYVFMGSISSIAPVGNDEMELQIVPEEVFWGKPDNPLTVLTSQGLCFPTIAVGDRWLFYLRKEGSKPIILDYYGNDSAPLSEARMDVDALRNLQKIGGSAMLRGRVVRGKRWEGKPVHHARVVARGMGDTYFVAVTDSDGRYEFQSLPPGKYVVTVQAKGSHRPDTFPIDIRPGECLDMTPDRIPF